MQSQNFCPLKTINPTVEHYGIYRYRCNENNKVKAISGNGTIDVCVYDATDAGDLRLTHEYRGTAKDGKDFIRCTYPAESNYGCNLLIGMNKHNGILYKKEVWWMKDSPLKVEEVGNKKLSLT